MSKRCKMTYVFRLFVLGFIILLFTAIQASDAARITIESQRFKIDTLTAVLASSSTHPDQSLWYQNDRPVFTWIPVISVSGYYTIFDQQSGTVPTVSTGSLIIGTETSYSNTSDGAWYFHIVAELEPGVADTVAAHVPVKIDTSPPSLSSTTHPDPSEWTKASDVQLSWSVLHPASVARYYYLIDGNTATIPTASTGTATEETTLTLSGYNDGTHYLHVVWEDQAGNIGTTAGHYGFWIDTIPPQPVTELQAQINGVDVSLTWTDSVDMASGIAYYQVFRSESEGVIGRNLVDDDTVTESQYVDSGAGDDGVGYFYMIFPVDGAGNIQRTGNVQVQLTGETASIQTEPPDLLDFGDVPKGSSKSMTLKITNTGEADLVISRIASDQPEFTVSDLPQSPISSGGEHEITVTFNSQNAGEFNATLTIESNASNEPTKQISLSANVKDVNLIAQISYPASDQYVRDTGAEDVVEIIGTAKVISGTLKNWQLYYSPGDQTQGSSSVSHDAIQPKAIASWERLTKSTEVIEDAILFKWDTTSLNQSNKAGDVYTLRLWVDSQTPSQIRKETMVAFIIDNVKPEPPSIDITSSSGGSDYVKNNDMINVAGSVDEPDLIIESVTLRVGSNESPVTEHSIVINGTSIEGSFQVGEVSGPVRVLIAVKDLADNDSAAGSSNSLLTDNNKPTSVIERPAYAANFQFTPIEISGIASDPTSQIVEIEIKFGDGDWKTTNGTENWIHQYDPKVEWPGYEDTDCYFWVRAYDSVGNVSEEAEGWVQFYFDDPACNISQPIDGETLSGNIEIRGSASDKNTQDETFLLEYVEGEDAPDSADWIAIDAYAPPITDGVMAIWDASKLNGTYTLRLKVTGKSSTIVVKRKNLHIFPEGEMGDVNDDSVVDAKDAREILRHVVGLPPAEQFIESRADVSENGSVTAYDAALIFQKVAGLIE